MVLPLPLGLFPLSALKSIFLYSLYLFWLLVFRFYFLKRVPVSLSVSLFSVLLSCLWDWTYWKPMLQTWAPTLICWLSSRIIPIWDSFPYFCLSLSVLSWPWLYRRLRQRWRLRLSCVPTDGAAWSWEQHWCWERILVLPLRQILLLWLPILRPDELLWLTWCLIYLV